MVIHKILNMKSYFLMWTSKNALRRTKNFSKKIDPAYLSIKVHLIDIFPDLFRKQGTNIFTYFMVFSDKCG